MGGVGEGGAVGNLTPMLDVLISALTWTRTTGGNLNKQNIMSSDHVKCLDGAIEKHNSRVFFRVFQFQFLFKTYQVSWPAIHSSHKNKPF